MVEVEIIHMGAPFRGLNLAEVVRIGNRAQKHFRFSLGDGIPNLGDPDDEGKYNVDELVPLLKARRVLSTSEVFVGIIDSPLQDELFSAVDSTNNHIVVSIDDIAGILTQSNQSYLSYVLVEIAAQLLTIEYRRTVGRSAPPTECEKPWHKPIRSCLFDYCDDRSQSRKKLIWGKLCDHCKASLSEANVRQTVIDACLDLVNKAVRTKLYAVLQAAVSNPFAQIVFSGSVISLLILGLVQSGFQTWEIITVSGLMVLTIVVIQYFRMKRPHS